MRIRLSLAIPLLLACSLLSSCQLLQTGIGVASQAYSIKLIFSCLPEGTQIDTPTGTASIESLRAGDLIIGYEGTPVRILQKHEYQESPEGARFRRIAFADGATVELCDLHRLAGVPSGKIQVGQQIAGSEVISVEAFGGVVRSYDLLTDDAGYQISGIPVNSMIEEMAQAAR